MARLGRTLPNRFHQPLPLPLNNMAEGAAPANTAVPTVSGTVTVGQVLSTTDGTWTGIPAPTFTYQWQDSADGSTGWANIASATNSTYTIGAGENGLFLRSTVTGTNTVGAVTANSAATTAVGAASAGTARNLMLVGAG